MNCNHIQELLPAYQDGEVSADEARMIKSHLGKCDSCSQESAAMSQAWDLLGTLEPIQVSPTFEARFWARVQREKALAPAWKRWLPFSDLRPLVAGALASVLVSVVTGTILFQRVAEPSVTDQGIAVFTAPYGLNSIASNLVTK